MSIDEIDTPDDLKQTENFLNRSNLLVVGGSPMNEYVSSASSGQKSRPESKVQKNLLHFEQDFLTKPCSSNNLTL